MSRGPGDEGPDGVNHVAPETVGAYGRGAPRGVRVVADGREVVGVREGRADAQEDGAEGKARRGVRRLFLGLVEEDSRNEDPRDCDDHGGVVAKGAPRLPSVDHRAGDAVECSDCNVGSSLVNPDEDAGVLADVVRVEDLVLGEEREPRVLLARRVYRVGVLCELAFLRDGLRVEARDDLEGLELGRFRLARLPSQVGHDRRREGVGAGRHDGDGARGVVHRKERSCGCSRTHGEHPY
mmetsp:Transcript_5180/g.11494  ORF Transcript_5180/g.11494 Transcript_5180/m.11494 type:complete len:238 (+) Transcript_5180:237-950(+)